MSPLPPPPLPRYGERSLADVMPSVLAAVGLRGFDNILSLEPFERACVLLVDGLGWQIVDEYGELAPTLAIAARRGEPIDAGYPATTAASLGSLGTGLPPGEHGLIGYTMEVPGVPALGGRDRALDCILWAVYGMPGSSLLDRISPEEVQAAPTVLERAAGSGLEIVVVSRREYEGSGLTRATLRGGRQVAADSIDEQVRAVREALAGGGRGVASTYYPGLDATGHRFGVGSDPWRQELREIDRLVALLADSLPAGAALFVTADHGMINLAPEEKLDIGDVPELSEGVRLLAGEGRARHVQVREGAAADVPAAWRERLGDRMWIRRRDEAIGEGWFGPRVDDRVRGRIGDVVAAAAGPIGIFERDVDPYQPTLVGHHGSMTPAEQLVPLLEFRR